MENYLNYIKLLRNSRIKLVWLMIEERKFIRMIIYVIGFLNKNYLIIKGLIEIFNRIDGSFFKIFIKMIIIAM